MKLFYGLVVMMVMHNVEGIGEAEQSQLHLGGEGVDAHAVHVRWVDHEEHLL
jgi:hypothetical protein